MVGRLSARWPAANPDLRYDGGNPAIPGKAEHTALAVRVLSNAFEELRGGGKPLGAGGEVLEANRAQVIANSPMTFRMVQGGPGMRDMRATAGTGSRAAAQPTAGTRCEGFLGGQPRGLGDLVPDPWRLGRHLGRTVDWQLREGLAVYEESGRRSHGSHGLRRAGSFNCRQAITSSVTGQRTTSDHQFLVVRCLFN